MLKKLAALILAAILCCSCTVVLADEDGEYELPIESDAPHYNNYYRRNFYKDSLPEVLKKLDIWSFYMSRTHSAAPAVEAVLFTEAEFEEAASVLSGKVIGIDPGHQLFADHGLEPVYPGSDLTKTRQSAGCTGVRSQTPEHRINLLVALKLREYLESCGATVVMTRETPYVYMSNIERAELMNSCGADIWIRIHCNYSHDPDASGACVLIPSQTATPDIYEYSLYLGNCISGSFGSTVTPAAVTSLDTQTGFNWSAIPVAAIEMGHLSNEKEDALLNSDIYQNNCAIGIFRGIAAYFTGISRTQEILEAEDVTIPAELDGSTIPEAEPVPDDAITEDSIPEQDGSENAHDQEE